MKQIVSPNSNGGDSVLLSRRRLRLAVKRFCRHDLEQNTTQKVALSNEGMPAALPWRNDGSLHADKASIIV
jgi:hypothetical protein